MMSEMKKIGETVARVRKQQGFTQLELSQAADVGRRFVVELEAGKETIHAGKMLKVMSVLGIDFRLVEPQGV
jgi:HTH-type transcriptional regulator / antitoxin HipB